MSEVTLELPDEVVTDVKVRYADLPGVDGPVALLTMDNGFDHTRPTTWGPGGLARLEAALDEVEGHQPAVAAIVLTGKPFIFNVGADLNGVTLLNDRPHAEAIGRLGHHAFHRIRNARVPSFALINGAVMGGGLEVALHCDYRTISVGVPALAFPECFLGLVPGWGGTQLLPNLIGPDPAVTVIVENALNQNRMLNGKRALDLGIADAIFETADFLEESLRWVAKVLRGEVDPKAARTPVERGDAWKAAVARGRAIADAKLSGAAPAPYRALDLIALAETAPYEERGAEAEVQALADMILSEELRAGVYSFNLTQKRARKPAGAPDKSLARPVTKVGIVGAGLMASQLGLLFARRLEVPVVLTDIDQERIDKGVGWVHHELDQQLAKKRLSSDKASRLKAAVTGSLTKDAFSDADLVIEAVFEDMKVKQQVFGEVEAEVKPETLLLTNTSSLSVGEMAADLEHPERVVGFHFFNPVAVLPLLEVVRAERTDDASLATAFEVARKLGKSAVLARDTPAFVVNRILTRFLGEVLGAADAGTPIEVADRALKPLGLPMSPFMLLGLVGPAIALHVGETLAGVWPDRFRVSPGLTRMVAAGKGQAFTWGPDGQKVDPQVAAAFAPNGPSADAPTEEEVRERALNALAQEIKLMLDEQVVHEALDIDLCMILGAGWPFHLGGITPYLDRTGVSQRVNGTRFLPKGVATLP